MPTQSEIDSIASRIRSAALMGTPTNPKGLPPTLSDLLVAQSKHETGDYTSNAFLKDNNAFGYSYVPGGVWQIGPGIIADNGAAVARYATIEDSTSEMVDWIYRRIAKGVFPANLNDIQTPVQYAHLLKAAGYYGDTFENYVEGLRRWFVRNPEVINSGLLVAGLIATIWVLRKQLKKLLTIR
jgi:hypothetical protein